MAGVARDGTSSIYCPATAGQWTTTLAAASIASGGPSALHLMQDAAGGPADAIGTFTMTVAGAGRTYQQAVTGWTRLSITHIDNATSNMMNTDALLPDIGTNSCLMLLYGKLDSTPAAQRTMIGMGTTNLSGRMTATPTVNLTNGVTSATGAGNPSSAVRPYVLKMDRTNSLQTLYTDQEKISPAFNGTPTGKRIWLGGVGSGGGPISHLYLATFFNAAAELSDAQVKTLLQTLGFTIAW